MEGEERAMTNKEPQAGEVYTDASGQTREVELIYSYRLPATGKHQIQVKYAVPTKLGPIKFSCTLDEWQAWAADAKRVSVEVAG
jgi:hypothetical protein